MELPHVLRTKGLLTVVFLQRAASGSVTLLTTDQPLGRVAEQAGVQVELIGNT